MSIASLARREIRDLEPYEAAVQIDNTLRLNANEAPWTNDSEVFRRPLNRYPEIRPAHLRAALAQRFDCTAKQLLVTRGSSEAIDLLIRVFCRAGKDGIATATPTFSMYAHYAHIQGAQVQTVTTSAKDDFAVNVSALADRCDENTRLIFLCSPNNPTGTCIERDAIIDLLERRSQRSAVVVDEAYIEFSSLTSTINLLERYDNLIILRTLSKALGFAGARCGAVIASPDVIQLLNAVQAPYALATPVVECVENALQANWLQESGRRVQEIVSERERVMTEFRKLPWVRRVFPSQANFFLAELRDSHEVLRQTRSDGVLLRFFKGDLDNYVRITVGTATENDQLLRSLNKIGRSIP